MANIPPWNPTQLVSCSAPSQLNFYGWYAIMKSHPGSELLCTFLAQFLWLTSHHEMTPSWWVALHLLSSILWLTCHHETPPREWVAPSELYFYGWYAIMKSHPACELLYILWAQFLWLICCYEIPPREWVALHLLSSISMADMPSWNPT